jgi:ketosteroid isomerase-like protein
MSTQASSNRRATVSQFLKAFDLMTLDALMSYRAPDCVWHLRPASLNRTPLDNAAYIKHIEPIIGILKKISLNVKEMLEDERENKIMIWCDGAVEFWEDVGIYEGEWMFVLSFDGTGKLVERVVEFVDTLKSAEFLAQVGEARKLRDERKEKGKA